MFYGLRNVVWVMLVCSGSDCPAVRLKGADMAITSAPVDPARFSGLMFMSCEPKLDRDTGAQHTTKDGSARKWVVSVAATKPANWDATQMEKDVLSVTVTSADDPADGLVMGTPVTFDDFSVGVMAPEARGEGENMKIRGGRLFWSANGVRSLVASGRSRD